MQAVLPQFLQDFWLLTELSPCPWSLRQNTSSSPLLNHVYLKRSSFKYFSMAPVPSLIYSVQLFKTGLRETGMVNNKPLSRQALIQLLALPKPSVLKVFPKNLHSPSLLDSSKRRYHLSLQTLILLCRLGKEHPGNTHPKSDLVYPAIPNMFISLY